MKKILILGSSHVGSIKIGFDAISSLTDKYCIKYAALQASYFAKFKIIDRAIHVPSRLDATLAKTYGEDAPILLDAYDKIVFAHGPCRLSLHLYTSSRNIPPLSDELVKSIALFPTAPKLFLDLAKIFQSSRLIYIGSPLKSESISDEKNLKFLPLIRDDSELERASRLSSLVRHYCDNTLTSDSGPAFLLPPADLLTHSGFNTLDSFIRGGARFDGRLRLENLDSDFYLDVSHGNSKYGERMARVLTSVL